MLNAAQTPQLVRSIERELALRQAKIDKLTFEIAQLRRARFGARTEQFSHEQAVLFEEDVQTKIDQIAAQPTERAARAPRYAPAAHEDSP